MQAFKTYITVTDPGSLVLKGLPFQPGQRVEVVVIAEEGEEGCAEFQSLLRQTQNLPASRSIRDDEIAAEVAAYRAGH